MARSIKATSAAEISYSGRSRQAKATKVASAPMPESRTSHQMCQIMAKPKNVAKKAVTNPVGVFLGASIGW